MSSGSAATSEVQSALAAIEQASGSGRISPGAATNLNRWLTEPSYRAFVGQILDLVRQERFEELDSLFWEVIPFGTGGRRGLMADLGSATINDRTVAESASGLAVYLQQVKGAPGGRAVIAHDTRNNSRRFAELAATTLAAYGLDVFLFESHRSTPELSFAVLELKCDVGVMISASHNPPGDNGVKVYWSNGAQVLPPHDKGIIECVYKVAEIPSLDFDAAVKSGQIVLIGEAIDQAYIHAVAALSLSTAREIPAVFTPLHGVGETNVYKVLQEVDFRSIRIFDEQRYPDGNFPTVPNRYPNPEQTPVFDAPIAYARQISAELVLASDPDADRLGVSVRDAQGDFVHLSGNRVGALLTDYVLRKRKVAGTLTPQSYVVETLVTTPLVAAITRSHGVRIIDDLLVGFKYIAQVMDREGPEHFVFGAEESLGYLAGSYARDKDAAIAALWLAEAAAELRLQGRSLLSRLDELFVEHGYFLESQSSETCKGPKGRAQIEQLMRAFTESPPQSLAGIELKLARDYRQHEVRQLPGNARVADLPEPQGDMVIFEAGGTDCQITLAVRPSGTEPKIKFYFFARSACPNAAALPGIKEQTEARLRAFQEALSAWARSVWES